MVNNYFAGYTFTTPPASAPFGNAGRDAFRAPGLAQWDLGVNKNFRIREDLSVQFRSEFFNVLNHTNFGIPNGDFHQRGVWDDPVDLSVAADPVCAEVYLLMFYSRHRSRLPLTSPTAPLEYPQGSRRAAK